MKQTLLLILCSSMISACGSVKVNETRKVVFEWVPEPANEQAFDEVINNDVEEIPLVEEGLTESSFIVEPIAHGSSLYPTP